MLLRNERVFEIVTYLIINEGARSGMVAKELDISPSTASHHLKRLEKEGIISKGEHTQEYKVVDPKKLADIVIDFRPGDEGIVDSFIAMWEEISQGLV